MLAYLLAPENFTFAIALGLLCVIGGVQAVSLILGAEVFGFLQNWVGHIGDHGHLPGDVGQGVHVDVGHGGGELSLDHHTPSFGEAALSLLGVGKVPFIFTFLTFLFGYSCIGYNLQWLIGSLSGSLWPFWLASLAAFALNLPVLRLGNEALARVIPRDESYAVSEESFVGKLAVIVIGTVTFERSSEAKLTDDHGRTHYVQVVADEPSESFSQGAEVVLVGKRGSLFTVVGTRGLLSE